MVFSSYYIEFGIYVALNSIKCYFVDCPIQAECSIKEDILYGCFFFDSKIFIFSLSFYLNAEGCFPFFYITKTTSIVFKLRRNPSIGCSLCINTSGRIRRHILLSESYRNNMRLIKLDFKSIYLPSMRY